MSRRSQRVLGAAVLLLQVGAWRTWETARSTSAVPSTGTSISRARVVPRDGSPPLTLADVTVRSDSVSGYLIDQARSRMAFVRAGVVDVETEKFSPVRTDVAGLAVAPVALYALPLGIARDRHLQIQSLSSL